MHLSQRYTNITDSPGTGTISEVLVFDRLLSALEKTAVQAYLAEKWNLTSIMDSDGDGVIDDDEPSELQWEFASMSDSAGNMLDLSSAPTQTSDNSKVEIDTRAPEVLKEYQSCYRQVTILMPGHRSMTMNPNRTGSESGSYGGLSNEGISVSKTDDDMDPEAVSGRVGSVSKRVLSVTIGSWSWSTDQDWWTRYREAESKTDFGFE